MFFRIALARIAIAAVLLIALASAGWNAPRASACTLVEPKTGDLNLDGRTDSRDALSIDFFTAGLMPAPSKLWMAGADVNCDSSVNTVDASLILQADAGLYHIRP
jgi:hypothetical protein